MKSVVFFSVFNGSRLDAANHRRVLNKLSQFNPVSVNGSYKGKLEQSIMLELKYLSLAQTIARRYKQESLLEVGSNKLSMLYFLKSATYQGLGTMKKVSKREALKRDAWSEVNGLHYIVE